MVFPYLIVYASSLGVFILTPSHAPERSGQISKRITSPSPFPSPSPSPSPFPSPPLSRPLPLPLPTPTPSPHPSPPSHFHTPTYTYTHGAQARRCLSSDGRSRKLRHAARFTLVSLILGTSGRGWASGRVARLIRFICCLPFVPPFGLVLPLCYT